MDIKFDGVRVAGKLNISIVQGTLVDERITLDPLSPYVVYTVELSRPVIITNVIWDVIPLKQIVRGNVVHAMFNNGREPTFVAVIWRDAYNEYMMTYENLS